MKLTKHWKFPGVVKACRSLDESLCDVFGSYSTTDVRLRKLGVLSFQAKMADYGREPRCVPGGLGPHATLLYEIDDELKNQTGDETGEQNSLEQSP